MEYDTAVAYIERLMRFGVNLGLERINLLLSLLGNPHLGQRIIHVGGTNGKGSTAAMLAGICRAAGYHTGFFSSPHLRSYTERMAIDGRLITPPAFAQLVADIKPAVTRLVAMGYEPTEFEVLTAMALLYFRRRGVDLVVLEVGLGGDLDSTNVAPETLATIITNVSYDHMDKLGRTLEEIARAKAGIIKPGGYVVTAVTAPEAGAVIAGRCHELQARLFDVYKEARWWRLGSGLSGQYFTVETPEEVYEHLFLPLLGEHQLINAATAVTAVSVLRRFRGLDVPAGAVRRGLATLRWPGRLEVVAGAPAVILDVAHNTAAALALREALVQFHFGRLVLVVGMLDDKERERFMAILAPLAKAVVVTRPASTRAEAWEEVATFARCYTGQVYTEREIEAALARARTLAGRFDLILVTGSFYLVGEARACLIKEES